MFNEANVVSRLLKPQPDNREFLESDGDHDEACIGVLNNFYQVFKSTLSGDRTVNCDTIKLQRFEHCVSKF